MSRLAYADYSISRAWILEGVARAFESDQWTCSRQMVDVVIHGTTILRRVLFEVLNVKPFGDAASGVTAQGFSAGGIS